MNLRDPRVQNGDLLRRPARPADAVAILLTVTFFLAGCCLIPYAGLQMDEVLFGSAIYAPRLTPAWISIFKKPLPVMILPYLGALKAWLYAPLLAVLSPTVWTVRVPVLLLGSLTLWMFYRLVRRLAGGRAALASCALLATDTTYLLTTCFDWGPVVLQRFLAVAGVSCVVRFHDRGSWRALAAGFFLFGLGLWDKALFGWTLAGLAAGVLAAAPGALRRALSVKSASVSVLFLLLGAYPLIRYNVHSRMETARWGVGWSTEDRVQKLHVLRSSLDGSSLLGYISTEDPAPRPRQPRNPLERLSVFTDTVTGRLRFGWLGYALAAAILALPLLWRTPARPPMLFSLTTMAVAWALMFFGKGVGVSTHHVALMWPWPHLLVGTALAGMSRWARKAGAAVLIVAVALICGKSVLVTNVYLSQFIRNGAAGSWTDAIQPLSDVIGEYRTRQIVVLDWGMFEQLRLLHRGRLNLAWDADPLAADPPDRVFIMHTDAHEQLSGVNARLREKLAAAGRRREVLHVVNDSNGRAVYEVFRVPPL